MADTIASLMAQLGSMRYSAPSSYKSPSFKFDPIKYKSFKSTPWNFTQDDFKSLASKKKSGSGINLWDVLNDTLGQSSGIFTNSAYNIIKDLKDKDKGVAEKVFDVLIKDSVGGSLVQGFGHGAKEQLKDWKDGKWSWGDIPSVGFLHGMGKGWKRGTDIMEEAGVKNRWGKVGGGIALDIALDPLTYFTGGISAASKLGKAAEIAKTAELAKGLGMTGKFRKADDFLNAAEQLIKSDLVRRNPHVSETLVNKTVAKKIAALADEIKTSRNTTFNAHINDWGFSVPFSKKVLTVGKYGKKNLLHRTEELVPRNVVDDLLKKSSFGDKTLQGLLEQAVQHRYGVSHTGELSKTMFDDLHEFVKPIIKQMESKGIPDVQTISKVIEHAMPQEKFASLMNKFRNDNIPWNDVKNQLNDILVQVGHDPALRSWYGSHLAEMVSDYWKTKPIKNFNKVVNARKAESMAWASKFLKESDTYKTVEHTVTDVFPHGNPTAQAAKDSRVFDKQFSKLVDNQYNEMGNFKTNVEHFLGKHSPFNARTLATGDKFVNSMGEHIADAQSQRVGETARYTRSMDKVEKFVKKYSDDKKEQKQLMEHAIYILENHAPKKLGGKNWTPSNEAKQLANLIRPVIDRIGSQEQKAGILDKLRSNYFPHVTNHDPETMKAIEEFAKKNKDLNGTSSASKFNKERKSFQTLAQRDNYIESLEKAIQKETDSDKIKSLQEQQKRVADMFDTDVVSALQRRIKEGTRAKAMKALQGKLGKYGMMKTLKQGDKSTHIPSGLTELDASEAKKLGLGEGRHFIHPDVLKGMKRVDEVFTQEGMNKVVRHISAIADIWRPLVTYYKPSHYLNNIIGNSINNLAAGVKVRDYRAASKLIKGYRNGKLTESQMKIMEEAYKHNVISGGFLYDSHPTFTFSDAGKLEKIAKKVGDNKVIKQVRRLGGELPDDIARLANFVNGMDKYGKVSEAAKQVRTYLFNYNELTNADRTMRVLVPFWNWTKRNVPLQMKLLMENPKFALNTGRFLDMFNDGQDGADWQKEGGVKIPKSNYYKSIPSPVMDLKQLLNPREFASGTTPAIKMPIELLMNKKFYTGKPISYGEDNVQAEDLLQYIISNMGIGGNAYDAASGKKGVGESIINLFSPISKINNGN